MGGWKQKVYSTGRCDVLRYRPLNLCPWMQTAVDVEAGCLLHRWAVMISHLSVVGGRVGVRLINDGLLLPGQQDDKNLGLLFIELKPEFPLNNISKFSSYHRQNMLRL
jgi:hypothetical protein